MNNRTQFLLQLIVVLACGVFTWYFLVADAYPPSNANANLNQSSFDMLGFLDEQISCQEDQKDVRCWSSVNKLQMFVAGAEIEHEAVVERIKRYGDLIDSVWSECASSSNGVITASAVEEVLIRRFPNAPAKDDKSTAFSFDDASQPVFVMQDLVNDYSDTIETWRLLQSWAARKVGDDGRLELTPVFGKEALISFHEFLNSLDIAILKRAKKIANSRNLSAIDSESMALAFSDEASE